MKSMLVKVGWKKDMVEKNVPFLPISCWMGDNLLKQETSTGNLNMDWWKGTEVEAYGSQIIMKTLYAFLDKVCLVPEWPVSAPMAVVASCWARSSAAKGRRRPVLEARRSAMFFLPLVLDSGVFVHQLPTDWFCLMVRLTVARAQPQAA